MDACMLPFISRNSAKVRAGTVNIYYSFNTSVLLDGTGVPGSRVPAVSKLRPTFIVILRLSSTDR